MDSYILNWNITSKCNLKCKHCAMANNNYRGDLALRTNKKFLKRLIDECNIHTVVFSSLEPFKYENISELLNFCNYKGVATGIITNGTLIDTAIVKELINAKLTYLAISIEGISSQSNDIIRGQNMFEHVMESIKIIENVFEELGEKFQLALEINVHKKNLCEVDNFISFFNGLKFSVINIGEIREIGRATENNHFTIDESDHELAMNKIIFDYVNYGNGTYKIIPKSFMIYESIYYNVTYNASLFISKPVCPVSCGNGLSLSYDGKISACSFIGYDKNICMGIDDIPNTKINEALNIINTETQKKLIYSYTLSQDCLDCKFRNYCTICPIAYDNNTYKDLIKRCNKYRLLLLELADTICLHKIPFYIPNNVYLNVNVQNDSMIYYINPDGSVISEKIPRNLSSLIESWFCKGTVYLCDDCEKDNIHEAVAFLTLNGLITTYGGNKND